MPSTVRLSRFAPAAMGVVVALVLLAALLLLAPRGARSPRMGLSMTDSSASVESAGGGEMGFVTSEGKAVFLAGRDGDMAVTTMPAPMPPFQPSAGPTAADVDQKIIKNGTLRLTVDAVSASIDRITAIASDRKGFVQSSWTSERIDGTHDGEITIRVPAASFESAMQEIKKVATVVNYESASGQDVTEQFTDLQAQLRNAQAQETEYLRILQRATSVQDILAVQAQLGNIRASIESLQGRIQYLENLTAYSTIGVSLSEEPSVTLPTKEFRPGAVVREAVQRLIEIGQDTVAALIWLVIVGGGTLLPLALIGGIIWAIIRARGRK